MAFLCNSSSGGHIQNTQISIGIMRLFIFIENACLFHLNAFCSCNIGSEVLFFTKYKKQKNRSMRICLKIHLKLIPKKQKTKQFQKSFKRTNPNYWNELQIRLTAGEYHAHSHTHLHLPSQQQQEAGFQLPREFVLKKKKKKMKT